MRTLISTTREVPRERRAGYDRAWDRLHAAATAQDVNAWRFASAARADRWIEFLEYKGDADPRRHREVDDALRALDACGTGTPETWVTERPRTTEEADGQS